MGDGGTAENGAVVVVVDDDVGAAVDDVAIGAVVVDIVEGNVVPFGLEWVEIKGDGC